MRKAIEQRSPWFLALTSYGSNGKSVEAMCLFKDSEGMGKRQSCGEEINHDSSAAYLFDHEGIPTSPWV
jgi:hypothetical protein